MEKHHKKHKADGGLDANPNRIWYCDQCHDFIHARDEILKSIKLEEARLVVLRKRLEIIERLNTPDNIHEEGYQSYFGTFPDPLPFKPKCAKDI